MATSFRSVIACGLVAWFLLALAVALVAFTVGERPDAVSPPVTKAVFDWLRSIPAMYRLVAAGVIGCAGAAMGVVTVRRYKGVAS